MTSNYFSLMKVDLSKEKFHANFPYLIMAILPVPMLYMLFQSFEVGIPTTLSKDALFEFGFSFVVIWACVAVFSKSIQNYFTK